MTKCVLLRVGIDSGCGGIQGPLFKDGTFEFVCIPDRHGVSVHTYGNSTGRYGRPFTTYFAAPQQTTMACQHVHVDPEFETFTYGDPTLPKRSLRTLESGDVLAFYAGLQRWDEKAGWNISERPGLYLVGYFAVSHAGMALDFTNAVRRAEFGSNFHVRYKSVYERQKAELVLVKGGDESRLFRKAHRISTEGRDRTGKPLKVLSPAMQKVFGSFDGRIAIQRSPPRWVADTHVAKAMAYLKSLV
jgi:Nucleotide modification associated domain 3